MKFLSTIRHAAAAALVGFGLFGMIAGPAAALTNPPQFAPRFFPTQQTHYERHVVTIAAGNQANSSVAAVDGQVACLMPASTTTTTCSVRIGAVPYNAFIVRGYLQVLTACNTGGTGPACAFSLGNVSGGAQFVSAASVATAGGGAPLTIVAANLGIAATGNGATSTGANGGFDIFMTMTQSATTMTEATTGTFVFILEYFANNDGGCLINVPIGGSDPAC